MVYFMYSRVTNIYYHDGKSTFHFTQMARRIQWLWEVTHCLPATNKKHTKEVPIVSILTKQQQPHENKCKVMHKGVKYYFITIKLRFNVGYL